MREPGRCIKVLMEVYAKVIAGQKAEAKRRISEATDRLGRPETLGRIWDDHP